MYTINSKRRSARRISVWVLVFALMLTLFASMTIPAAAVNMAGGMGEAVSDMGNAMGEAAADMGDGIGDAAADITDNISDGRVNDTDGFIGNQRSGADKDMNGGNTAESSGASDTRKAGWIALAIAIVVIVAVVVLAIVFIPKKKEEN